MSKSDDSKADEATSTDEVSPPVEESRKVVSPEVDDEDDDEDEDEEERASPVKSQRSAPGSGKGKRRSAKAAPAAPAAGSAPVAMSRVALFVVVALAAGGAAGWYGHDAQAKARVKAESAAAPAGSGAPAGPCGAWQGKICASSGAQSAACAQAKGATELLTASSCETALGAMPATLAKLKAARASCDSLVSKLCADLPPGSQACNLVKEKTPAFPSQRCDEMLKHYDEVLGSLREIDQQGMPAMGAPGGMARPPMNSPGPGPGSSPDH